MKHSNSGKFLKKRKDFNFKGKYLSKIYAKGASHLFGKEKQMRESEAV